MEAVFSSETLVSIRQSTRRNIPRDLNFRLLNIQGVSGGKINFWEAILLLIMSEKGSHEHVSNTEWLIADRQGTVPFDKKRYKLLVKSKNNQSVEYTRTLIKSKVDTTQLKVGISALKTLKNGQILIQSDSKSDLEEVNKRISETCGEELEGYIPTLKNPRLIVFNVPEDIIFENMAQAIVLQNSDLGLNESDIKPKFVFEDRRKHKNLVVEVNSETRKRLRDRKIKIGWHVCNSTDYLNVTRCYKCSKYNHRATECFGEVTCPHCAQTHKMHEGKASKENYCCINCTNYNKYNTSTSQRKTFIIGQKL